MSSRGLTADLTELTPPGVLAGQTDLDTAAGPLHAFVFRPAPWVGNAARRPAVALGAEATGVNRFVLRAAAALAERGHVVCVPDYYRGGGQADPEDYSDIPEIMRHVGALDFAQGTHDLMAAVDHLRGEPDVDHERVAVLGYCTGATLCWLTACLRPDVAAGVLFYPSQPVFEELTPKRPTHPMDLLWNLTCPTLFVYGDEDPVMPPARLAELHRRLERSPADYVVRLFPGAGHSFGAPIPGRYDPDAYQTAWQEALAFLDAAVQPSRAGARPRPEGAQ